RKERSATLITRSSGDRCSGGGTEAEDEGSDAEDEGSRTKNSASAASPGPVAPGTANCACRPARCAQTTTFRLFGPQRFASPGPSGAIATTSAEGVTPDLPTRCFL